MRAGSSHAQFLGVIVTVVALTTTAVFYAGSRVTSWAEEAHMIRVELEKEREVRQAEQQALRAQVAQARAEAIQRLSTSTGMLKNTADFRVRPCLQGKTMRGSALLTTAFRTCSES